MTQSAIPAADLYRRGFPDALVERTDMVRFYLRLTLGADRDANM